MLIFTAVFGQLEVLVDTVREIGDTIGLDGVYIRTMLKMIGITYAAELLRVYVRMLDIRRLQHRLRYSENC